MIAVLGLGLSVLGYLASPYDCKPFTLAADQAALEAYVDPSRESRSRIVDRIRKSVFVSIVNDALTNRPGSGDCGVQTALKVARFADIDGFKRLVAGVETSGGSAASKSAGPYEFTLLLTQLQADLVRIVVREGAVERSRVSVAQATDCAAGASSCTADVIENLLLSGRTTGGADMVRRLNGTDQEAAGWALWLSIAVANPTRDRRLYGALHMSVERSSERGARTLFDLAVREMVGSPDPRDWSIQDLALLSKTARDIDRGRLSPDSGPRGAPQTAAAPDQLTALKAAAARFNLEKASGLERQHFVEQILRSLAPLGFRNAFTLCEPHVAQTTLFDQEPDSASLREELQAWQHFDGEFELYANAYPTPPRALDQSQAEAKLAAGAQTRFIFERWKETDARAPERDLTALMVEIRGSEEARKRLERIEVLPQQR